MRQWEVSFMYNEKVNGTNVTRYIKTAVTAPGLYQAQQIVYAQYGRNLVNLSIREMK